MSIKNSNLTSNSQALRKLMTPEEKQLWYKFLKDHKGHFRRQKVIGNYIVDFYSYSAKLVIELDGSQHYEPENREKDRVRDDYLRSLGLEVLRYTNFDIHDNFRGVCEDINKRFTQPSSTSKAGPPSP